jgi:hypothetical protein
MKRIALLSTTVALAVAIASSAAFADTGSAVAASSITDLVITGILAAAPGLVLGIWAWFKGHAAQTEAKWDDEAVAFVEKIAQGVVEKSKS